MATPIVMPKHGNSVEECLLTEWRVKVGDTVAAGDVVAGIETDKASFEIEAPEAGTVLALFWDEGDLVPVLQNIAVIGAAGEDFSALRPDGAAAAGSSETPATAMVEEPAAAPAAGGAEGAEQAAAAALSPRARRYAKDHPVDLAAVKGSGAGGRIIEADVAAAFREGPRLSPAAARLAAAGMQAPAGGTGLGGMVLAADMERAVAAPAAPAAVAPAAPAPAPVAAAAGPEVTETKLSNLRRIIAARLHESLSQSAQYTLNAEADATAMLELRAKLKEQGEALGLANVNIGDMVLYAVVKALGRHPEINAEFDGTTLRQHRAVHLGFACDTPRGLMVPVVRDAQALTLAQLSAQVKDLAKQASSGKLNPDLMQGGTFTVSNLGALGITSFTPVINAPQVGILGVGKTVLRPVRTAAGIVYRDLMVLSLTLDHRVVDGAPGARFLQTLVAILENVALVCVAG